MKLSLFKQTYFVYLALLMGQFLFCLFVIYLITQPDSALDQVDSQYPFLGLLVVFLAAGSAWYVNKLRNEQIPKIRANFEGKVLHYRTTVIMRSAMVEAGNLFCIILCMFEASLTPLLYFAVGLLVFLYFRPRVDEIATHYQLSQAERQQLEQQLKRG